MVDRNELDRIMSANGSNNWWKPELFELHARAILPKEITIAAPPLAEDENYNCFIYALGLAEDRAVVRDCHGFLYDSFFQKLLDLGELSETTAPEDGDLVLYRNPNDHPGMITHIGVKHGTQVTSKWAWGPLMIHHVFDVPASYGNDISYIKKVSPERAAVLYAQYKKFNTPPRVRES